jgi:alkylated DNA repair dioxygenase AlkB
MNKVTDKIIFKRDFINNSEELYQQLIQNTLWNESMISRKTACFGEPYDYSEQSYDFQPMSPEMEDICDLLPSAVGFKPNNCLLNYYENGDSKIGFHGDTIKMLEPETGIAIVSLGDTRIFQVRRKSAPTECYNYILPSGSLFYMPNSIQKDWQHGVPKVISDLGRISLTFRKMIPRQFLKLEK